MPDARNKTAIQGIWLFISTILVNLGNYLVNLLLGRWLPPEKFAEVGLLVTLLLVMSFVALAFQLTAARYAALHAAEAESAVLARYLSWLKKKAWAWGLIIAVLLTAPSLYWQSFFKTSSWTIFPVLGISVPIYLLMSIQRGALQGTGKFIRLAFSYQAEMLLRLMLTVIAVTADWGLTGISLAITGSLLGAWLVAQIHLPAASGALTDKAEVRHFLLLILVYECSQILINNCDVILVKHFFPPGEAGLYAALALIGRLVYFGTWTVVTLLFPLVIKLEKEGRPHLLYFFGGLLTVACLGGCIVVATWLFPEWMVRILFGEPYLGIAGYLWKYSLATALFACANVFVYYNVSLNRRLPVWLTIIAGLCQVVLIWKFHYSFDQVINIQIWLMTALILLLMMVQAMYEHGHKQTSRSIN
ncbi:MAG: hypothetical protein ACTHMC_22190 [Pseudobacter sp.]|uniref:hypothetical protein n=1 Tax=Pseudobacter sp. TaxID=2045420 RepID=UPI003F806E00